MVQGQKHQRQNRQEHRNRHLQEHQKEYLRVLFLEEEYLQMQVFPGQQRQ